jgi:UDPglucose 6-dehydrogenase
LALKEQKISVIGAGYVGLCTAVEFLRNAGCCILVTEWDEFKDLTPGDYVAYVRQPVLVDGQRIYDPEFFRKKLVCRVIGLGEEM